VSARADLPHVAATGTDLADDLATTGLALARCIASGATLICAAPAQPAHARHVAVEFLHPAIVGKRAVPALAADDRDPLADVRLVSRPGDVLIVLGDSSGPAVRALLRRAPAWGLTSIWFDTGTELGPGSTEAGFTPDHVLRVGRDEVGVTLGYHLLWELTHVVFEHPGLLSPEGEPPDGEVCITCSDRCEVVEVRAVATDGRATVLAGGHEEIVDASLVDGAGPDDLLLVHAGVALDRISESA
jgi:hydrogenase maturation factor